MGIGDTLGGLTHNTIVGGAGLFGETFGAALDPLMMPILAIVGVAVLASTLSKNK